MKEYSLDLAKQEIHQAWQEYKRVEPVCLNFGRVCYDWQQKLKTTELASIWKELGIEEKIALTEADQYLESIGVARLKIEKRANRAEPDDFEDIRKVAMSMLSIGYKQLKQTDVSMGLLDSAKTWAQGKLREKERKAA